MEISSEMKTNMFRIGKSSKKSAVLYFLYKKKSVRNKASRFGMESKLLHKNCSNVCGSHKCVPDHNERWKWKCLTNDEKTGQKVCVCGGCHFN